MPTPPLGLHPHLKSGHPALEFTNTVSNHASAQPGETLLGYADLLGWAGRVGWLDGDQVRALTRMATRSEAKAIKVLEESIQLREALYRIFVALTKNQPPSDSDLSIFNHILGRVTSDAHVSRHSSPATFSWEWNLDESNLDYPLRLIALSAADLLTSDHLPRLGQCADEDGCGWLFLDTTKNHSRRWCDINDCGNRAKQRRYQRARKST